MAKKCKDCKTECLQEIPAGCVPLYLSEDISCLDISKDEDISVNEAFIKQAKAYCKFLEDNIVDLQCLQGDCPECTERFVQSHEAVRKLLDFACNLDSSQVGVTSSLYCLSGLSLSAAKIRQREISWSAQALSDGLNFTYNMDKVISEMPAGYTINEVSVKANGYNKGSAATLLINTKEPRGGFKLKVDNFPVNVNFQINVGTPDGVTLLNKVVSINSASETGTNYVELDSSDYSDNRSSAASTQDNYNEIFAAAICQLRNLYNSLKNLQVSSCEGLNYADNHINTVIQTHSAALCDIIERLDNIGKENVTYRECDDDCGERILTLPLQDTIDRQQVDICSLKTRVKTLEEKLAELELRVEKCCNNT